ncbi:MAG: hypothetical protein VKJ04_10820 [Vampirovibrionales bacterium]|nr:hypothetical protein [Vampirovibrionales bacterium]
MGIAAVRGTPLYFSATGYALKPIPKMKFGTTAEGKRTDADQEDFSEKILRQLDFAKKNPIRMTRVNSALALGIQLGQKQREVEALGEDAQKAWAPVFEQLMGQVLPYWKELKNSIDSRDAARLYEKHHRDLPPEIATFLRERLLRGSQKELGEWLKPYYEPYRNRLTLVTAALERITMEHAWDNNRKTDPWAKALIELASVNEELRRDIEAARQYPAAQRKVWLDFLEPLKDRVFDQWQEAINPTHIPPEILGAINTKDTSPDILNVINAADVSQKTLKVLTEQDIAPEVLRALNARIVPPKVLKDAYEGTANYKGLKDLYPEAYATQNLAKVLGRRAHHPGRPLPKAS